MHQKRLAVVGLGVMLLAYLSYLIYAVVFEPIPFADTSQRDLGAARLFGEASLNELSTDWSEPTLTRIVDSRMHKQIWFQDLKDKLPIYKEDLGAVVSITSKVEERNQLPDPIVRMFTFTATSQHTKGTAKSKFLLFKDSQKWGVLLLEIQVQQTNPKSSTETGGT